MATPNITNILSPRVPFIDARSGLISREWYRFLLNLFVLTGSGQNTISINDLLITPPAQDLSGVDVQSLELTVSNTNSVQESQTAEIQKQIDGFSVVPQPQLGSMASVNIDWVPYIGFDTAPDWIGTTAGQFWFNSDTGAFNAKMGNNNITQQVGEEFFQYGKASAAISDVNLQLVYKTGTVGASGVITFAPAIAGITDADRIVGIATEALALNGFGRVTTMGTVRGVNTTGSIHGESWVDNDDIWYDPVLGGLTKVKPIAPNIKVQVGTVIKAGSGGSGSFSVRIAGSSILGGTDANVQLEGLANGDLLQYDGVAQYWKNVPVATVITPIPIEPVSSAVLTGSPFTYENTNAYVVDLLIGGTVGGVTDLKFSRDGIVWYNTGSFYGQFTLSPNDSIQITYVTAPDVTIIPR